MDYNSLIDQALQECYLHHASGLSTLASEELKTRILGFETNENKLQIFFASDGLTLDHKMVIEKIFKKNIPGEVTVYFKRLKQSEGSNPEAATKKINPFGLNIEKRAIPGVREVILVASGKGGVGKSTVSTNLAVALSKMNFRVGFLDADIYGPSAQVMFGVNRPLDITPDQKLKPHEAHGVKVVSFGFLSDARHPVIWRGPLVAKALEQLFYDVQWGELDYLVVDLPPGTGDVQLTIIEKLPIHHAIIVTTPQDVALIDAHKALSMFERLDVPVDGLVENMAHFHCPSCGHEEHIFGDEGILRFSLERKLPILAKIPLQTRIRLQSDQGQPLALEATDQISKPFYDLAQKISSRP